MISDAEVGGLDGLPDGIHSADTTLEDLLNDESLGCSSNSNTLEELDRRRYQDCLAVFIRGDFEQSLQKMYEYEFLTQISLQTNDKRFDLFLEACYSIGNFRRLGFRLQEVIRRTFTGESQVLLSHLSDFSAKSRLPIWNKYYSCCVSACLMDQPIDRGKSTVLETEVRRTISKFSREFADLENVPGFEELIETYLFRIEIELLQKTRSPSLYKQLCYKVPNLGHQLSQLSSTHKGKKFGEYIISRLETKPGKSKKPVRHHSKSSTENGPKATTSKSPASPKPAQNNAVQVVTRWKSLWVKYFSKVNLSRQNLLFLLFLILISLRGIKKLARLPRIFTNFSASLTPQLKNLLRLLSSI